MDRESPELIEREMEQTRESLTHKASLLEDKVIGQVEEATDTVQGTMESVQETVECVKSAVQDTVQSVSDTVKHSVQSMTDGMKEALDVRRHTIEHPWPMVGGAAAAGFVTGLLVFRRAESSASGGELPACTPRATAMAAPAATQRPAWLNDILDMAGREVKQIAQQVIAQAAASFTETVRARVPHLVERVVPGRSSHSSGTEGNGAQLEGGL
jgi:ElaB/YqjD/DUF883 family membrane-anchored ribosome-binding protein